MLDVCLHTIIDVESNKNIGFIATCVACGADVSEDAQKAGRSYKYLESLGYWVREFGGYGVKIDFG
jgi:hypothetical protein